MFNVKMSLPTAEEIKKLCPLSQQLEEKKAQFDKEIAQNMARRNKLTVVVGPCSADNPSAMSEYSQKLLALQQSHPNLLVVARVYTSKPHSNGNGYNGLCFQQKENEPCDIAQGIVACRKMMIDVLEKGLPVADELLFPQLYCYFDDVVSYWFLGARSSEDSFHRSFASGLGCPCGIKNPTSGVLESAINSVHAASVPCVFPMNGTQVETSGNNLAHLVLRGGLDKNGFFQNIDSESTAKCKRLLRAQGLCDFVMVDLSHANSKKVAKNQLENAVVAQDKNVDGVMAESYLFCGTSKDCYGVSKTDDCLDLANTATLLDILEQGFVQRQK